jgi:hypothetical protein
MSTKNKKSIAPAVTPEIAVKAQEVSSEVQSLRDKLKASQFSVEELKRDLDAISKLFLVLKVSTGIKEDTKFNLVWALMNKTAILTFLKEALKVIKTKG